MVGIGYGRGAVLTKAADQGFSKGMSLCHSHIESTGMLDATHDPLYMRPQ
jgi:hypothetical protein